MKSKVVKLKDGFLQYFDCFHSYQYCPQFRRHIWYFSVFIKVKSRNLPTTPVLHFFHLEGEKEMKKRVRPGHFRTLGRFWRGLLIGFGIRQIRPLLSLSIQSHSWHQLIHGFPDIYYLVPLMWKLKSKIGVKLEQNMLRAGKSKSPREVEIFDTGQRILQILPAHHIFAFSPNYQEHPTLSLF